MAIATLSLVRRAYDVGNTVACSLAVLAGIAAIYVIPTAIINGSHLRAAAEQARAAEIAAEDRDFCSALGLPPDNARFADCSRGIQDIRQKEDQRWVRETEGFF